MSKKVILTEQQHAVIINEILRETVEKIDALEAEGRLDEGFWDTIKYALSKLGRYKAGGKIFGKGSVDTEYADKIEQIIEKKGNEMIKQLHAKIKEENPQFPNNKDPQLFLSTVMGIASIYDSIIAATKKKPDEQGYMPIDVANGIINDLREYVKKYLDVDLAAVYSGFNEGEEESNIMSEEYSVTDEEMKSLDEEFGLNEADPLSDKDVRQGLKDKRGDGEDFQSSRMDTLKSNKLPLLMAGVGASMGAFSWLANTDWFRHLFDKPFNYTDTETTTQIVQSKAEVLNDIKAGEGVYKLLGRVTDHPLNGNSDPSELVNALKEIGGGDAHKGVDLLCQKGGVMMKPDIAAKGLHDLVNNPNQYNTLNDMFHGSTSGTGKLTPVDTTSYGTIAGRSLTSMIVKSLPQIITKTVIKTGIKAGAGYAAAKGFASVLGPIGLALVAGGALVKLVRMKGQKSSRAATLNALYQSMRNIDGGVGLFDNQNGEQGSEKGGDKGAGAGKGGSQDALYNSLKNLFQFIVNNKGTLGAGAMGKLAAGNRGDRTYKGGQIMKGGKAAPAGGQTQSARERFFKNQNQNAVREGEEMVFEGKYITDKRVLQYMGKSLPFDKVKNFEDLIGRVEYIRNVLRKMGANTGDKVIDGFLKQLESNPIMATDFTKLFAVNPDNPQEVNSLMGMVKEILSTVYSSQYKFGDMVTKMGTLGGGNINKLEEAPAYNATQPNKSFAKDAQSKTTFKNNLVKFLTTAMNLFQYLHKMKTQQPKQQPRAGAPVAEEANPIFENEINRIRKIMLG
jgi:hypothetical protein